MGRLVVSESRCLFLSWFLCLLSWLKTWRVYPTTGTILAGWCFEGLHTSSWHLSSIGYIIFTLSFCCMQLAGAFNQRVLEHDNEWGTTTDYHGCSLQKNPMGIDPSQCRDLFQTFLLWPGFQNVSHICLSSSCLGWWFQLAWYMLARLKLGCTQNHWLIFWSLRCLLVINHGMLRNPACSSTKFLMCSHLKFGFPSQSYLITQGW